MAVDDIGARFRRSDVCSAHCLHTVRKQIKHRTAHLPSSGCAAVTATAAASKSSSVGGIAASPNVLNGQARGRQKEGRAGLCKRGADVPVSHACMRTYAHVHAHVR